MEKVSLFDLSKGFNEVLSLALDPLVDLDVLEEGLQQIEGTLTEKCQNGIGLLKTLEARAAAQRAEAQRLTRSARALDNRIKKIKDWYALNLERMGKDKVYTDLGTMRVQLNPPRVEVNEAVLPAQYFDIIPETQQPNKARIKAALKAGEEVKGAQLVQDKTLRIS